MRRTLTGPRVDGAVFTGWGMQTAHTLPWERATPEARTFLDTDRLVRSIDLAEGTYEPRGRVFDELRWRHWVISWAVQHAIRFSESSRLIMVECGVGNGITTLFALRQAQASAWNGRFEMHLYDSWAAMRERELLPDEQWLVGQYANLDLQRTRRNLASFEEALVFHAGYIPESFVSTGNHPLGVNYLFLSLNSARPELAACEFFIPRMARRGILVVDDYGHAPFPDVRRALDGFFSSAPGILMPLPTGQAIYFAP